MDRPYKPTCCHPAVDVDPCSVLLEGIERQRRRPSETARPTRRQNDLRGQDRVPSDSRHGLWLVQPVAILPEPGTGRIITCLCRRLPVQVPDPLSLGRRGPWDHSASRRRYGAAPIVTVPLAHCNGRTEARMYFLRSRPTRRAGLERGCHAPCLETHVETPVDWQALAASLGRAWPCSVWHGLLVSRAGSAHEAGLGESAIQSVAGPASDGR